MISSTPSVSANLLFLPPLPSLDLSQGKQSLPPLEMYNNVEFHMPQMPLSYKYILHTRVPELFSKLSLLVLLFSQTQLPAVKGIIQTADPEIPAWTVYTVDTSTADATLNELTTVESKEVRPQAQEEGVVVCVPPARGRTPPNSPPLPSSSRTGVEEKNRYPFPQAICLCGRRLRRARGKRRIRAVGCVVSYWDLRN